MASMIPVYVRRPNGFVPVRPVRYIPSVATQRMWVRDQVRQAGIPAFVVDIIDRRWGRAMHRPRFH